MPIKRRTFLTGSLSTFGAAALPFGKFKAASKSQIGVALLGLGHYSSTILAPALEQTKHCRLTGIVTGTPEKVASWQARYPIPDSNVYSYENLSSIANNPEIDVVYIVTPTSTHKDFVVQAANAGKHVWCEKPMAMTAEECQKMIDVCVKNKVKLSIGYRMQHEPNMQRFRGFLTKKTFGSMKQISAYAGYAGGPGPLSNWRMRRDMGGGALYDMGVYPINGARYFAGRKVVEVKAKQERAKGFEEVDSSTYFTLRFDNGVEADCGTSVVKNFNHLRATCRSGWYELEPMQAYSGVTGYTSDGAIYAPFKGNQQAKQMDDDALAILNNTRVLVPGWEGLQDIQIVQAALRSAATTQDFVPV